MPVSVKLIFMFIAPYIDRVIRISPISLIHKAIHARWKAGANEN